MTVSNVVTNAVPAQNDELLASVRAEMERGDLTQADVSREAGINKTRLNQFLNDKYSGSNEPIVESLERWLSSRKARAAGNATLPQAPAFQLTPTARRIYSGLSYAQMAGDITVVYGGAGAGKTETAKEYQRQNPNVWIVTMSPDCASTATALEEICEAVGISVPSGAARMRRAIERRIRDTQGLLIIDEAQPLGTPALDAIRSLHDRTGVGLALIGNETVYARMTGGNRAAYLDRLFSRIGKRVCVNRPTKGDVTALVNAWEIKTEEAKQLLGELARGAGGLRRMTKILRVASMMAAGSGRPLNGEMIRAAVRDLEDAGGA